MDSNKHLINRMTEYTFKWIYHNGYELELCNAKDTSELKKMVARKIGTLSDSFIKGAKLVKWDTVLQVLKSE